MRIPTIIDVESDEKFLKSRNETDIVTFTVKEVLPYIEAARRCHAQNVQIADMKKEGDALATIIQVLENRLEFFIHQNELTNEQAKRISELPGTGNPQEGDGNRQKGIGTGVI